MITSVNQSATSPTPALTLLFGPPRSGTSYLQKMLCQYCNGIGIYEPTGVSAFQGIGAGINPYDQIVSGRHPHIQSNPGVPVIVKEVQDGVMRAYLVRHDHDLSSWVNLSRLGQARVLWIFRDPLEVWRSIVAEGWEKTHRHIEAFLAFCSDAYVCYESMQSQAPQAVVALAYERLIGSLQVSLSRIAGFAGLAEMPRWSDAEDGKNFYCQRVHCHPSARALMESLNAPPASTADPPQLSPRPR